MGVAWVCVGIPVSLTFLLLLLLFPETPKNRKALLCSGSVPVCLTYLLKTSRTCLTPLPSLPRSSLTTHQVLLREAWLTCGRVVLVRRGVRERDGI